MQRVVTANRPAVEEAGEHVEASEKGEEGGNANVEIVLDVKVVAGEGDELLWRPCPLMRCRDGHGVLLDGVMLSR